LSETRRNWFNLIKTKRDEIKIITQNAFKVTKHYWDETRRSLLFEQDLSEIKRDWFNIAKIERV